MASILNCSINAKLLLAVGLPASAQKAQLKTVVVARIANGVDATIDWHSMGNAQAAADPMSSTHTAHSARLYAATHKRSFRNHTATDSPRGRDMAFGFTPTFATKRVWMYGMGDSMERDT